MGLFHRSLSPSSGVDPIVLDGHLTLNSTAACVHRRSNFYASIVGMGKNRRGLEIYGTGHERSFIATRTFTQAGYRTRITTENTFATVRYISCQPMTKVLSSMLTLAALILVGTGHTGSIANVSSLVCSSALHVLGLALRVSSNHTPNSSRVIAI